MKVVILHGKGSNHEDNWFPWLKTELEKLGHNVWVPDLPNPETPNIKVFNEYLTNSSHDFNDNIIIGHSSGSVAILGLLQDLNDDNKINTAILVGTFHGNLGSDELNGVDIQINYELVKTKSKKFIVIQENNDPRVPLEGGKWVGEQLGAELIIMPGNDHFSYMLNPKYREFPELLEIIKTIVK
jgi:uncharacterized protein